MNTPWEDRLAQRTQRLGSSVIRELLKLTEDPEIISFAGGLPAPDVFPVARFQQATEKVLAERGKQALQYSATEGYKPLREMIARHTARYGIAVDLDNILITSGSQQALDLVGKLFINPGDRLLVERPTYLGALQAWNAYQAEYVAVPLDDDGMRTDQLKDALRSGTKFIYALPNFHNPAGVTLALERREQLIAVADEEGVPIIEDDPYGQLRYAGEHLPPLVALDAQRRDGTAYSGNVIYLSTFSKTLAPGLRLGWVIAPPAIVRRLAQVKQGADLHTSTFAQMVAYEAARGGFLDAHIKTIRAVYQERRQVMLDALEAHFPEGVRWTEPQGGLFLWAALPEGVDTAELLRAAVEAKVAFVPGSAFHTDGAGRNTMRLNFSYCPPETIRAGVERLGGVVRHALEEQRVRV